ncbi:hypothetical protein SNEBB_003947 [Seison nebaliae]|nr:hypothetical protein SNEBB_003947 [Seison nebaliae]
MSLTDAEKKVILATWDVVYEKKQRNEAAFEFFMLFFKMYPTYQSHFKFFKSLTEDELRNNKKHKLKLTSHAMNVFANLNLVVENLDDPDVLGETLRRIGHAHHGHQSPKVSFLDLQKVFAVFGKDRYKLSEEYVKIWDKAWNILRCGIEAGWDDAASNAE